MAMDWEDRRRAGRRAYGYDRDYASYRDRGQAPTDRMNEERRPTRMYDDDDSRYRANRYDRGHPGDYQGEYDDYPAHGSASDSRRYEGGFTESRRSGDRDYNQGDPYGGGRSRAAGYRMGLGAWPYTGGRGYGVRGYGDRGYGGHDYGPDDDRGFMDRAGDEIASWFGDEDAEQRRAMDRGHRGRGPKNYTRSDDRIREDVCDRIADDPHVDASDLEVSVSNGEVTLDGTVDDRFAKRHTEDIVENVSGVKHVQNNLRIRGRQSDGDRNDRTTGESRATTGTGTSRI